MVRRFSKNNSSKFIKMTKNKHGGKRKGSGRKPLFPNGSVSIYVTVPKDKEKECKAAFEKYLNQFKTK